MGEEMEADAAEVVAKQLHKRHHQVPFSWLRAKNFGLPVFQLKPFFRQVLGDLAPYLLHTRGGVLCVGIFEQFCSNTNLLLFAIRVLFGVMGI